MKEAHLGSNLSKRELLRQNRKEQKRRKLITVMLIILGVGALFTTAIMLPKILMDRATYSSVEGFTIGNQDAPVTVVQFSSYSCGFCKVFSENQEPDFIANYVDTGQVFYRYVNIPSNDATSQLAAKASYCAADQDGFFEYRDFLYENSTSPEGFSTGSLINYADAAGLQTDEFQACLDGNTFSTAFMEDIQYAQNFGITFTPSFLVNDQLVGADELIPTVDKLLGR
jgi:protein-disulfide isomerase